MRKKARKPDPVPTVNYESVIEANAAEITARTDLKRLAPEFRTEEHRARLHAQHVEGQRERFNQYEVLGNHFADVMENPDTPAEVVNALGDELLDLADRAGLAITSPEVLRLLYPLLRDRAFRRGKGRP